MLSTTFFRIAQCRYQYRYNETDDFDIWFLYRVFDDFASDFFYETLMESLTEKNPKGITGQMSDLTIGGNTVSIRNLEDLENEEPRVVVLELKDLIELAKEWRSLCLKDVPAITIKRDGNRFSINEHKKINPETTTAKTTFYKVGSYRYACKNTEKNDLTIWLLHQAFDDFISESAYQKFIKALIENPTFGLTGDFTYIFTNYRFTIILKRADEQERYITIERLYLLGLTVAWRALCEHNVPAITISREGDRFYIDQES